jgi:hypothetical protein
MEHPTIIACSTPAKWAKTAIFGVKSVNGSAVRALGIE